MESTLTRVPGLYSTLEVLDVSPLDLAYDKNGNINFNSYYLARAGVWNSSPGPSGSTLISPNPTGHADILFQYDLNGNIEPVPRT